MRHKTRESRSKRIWSFLEKRPYIALKRLCTDIGYDRANFGRLMDRKSVLSEENILKIEDRLEQYGLFGWEYNPYKK